MDFQEIKEDFNWGIKAGGKGQGHTNLDDEQVNWLIQEVERLRKPLEDEELREIEDRWGRGHISEKISISAHLIRSFKDDSKKLIQEIKRLKVKTDYHQDISARCEIKVIPELEQEVEKLREALESIMHSFRPLTIDNAVEIARKALESEGK